MARRRGNKKRRDTERDSTPLRRIAKVGAVTAGVIAGGAAFRHSDMGRRLASSGLAEAAIKSTRGFKRDMLNNPVNIRTLKSAYDKNVGKNGKLIKEEAQRIKENTSKNLSNTDFIKKLHMSKQSKEVILNEGRKEEHLKRKDKFVEQILKNSRMTGKKADKMKDVIDSAYMHTTDENVKDGTMMSYLNKKIKKSGFAEDDIKSLLDDIVKYKDDNHIDNEDIQDLYGSLADMVSQQKREALKHNTQSGLLNKIDKRFNTKLEEFILGNRAATLGDMERLGLLEDTDFGKRIIKQFMPDEGEYKNTKIIDYNKEIKHLLDQGVFNDSVLDRGLRIAIDENGVERLIDNREAFGLLDNIKQAISDTLPGKLLLKNMDLGDKKTLGVLHSGTRDLNAHLTGSTNNIMQSMMVYMDGNLYGTTTNASGEVVFDNTVTKVKQTTGWRKKIVRDILGTNQQPVEAYDNKWLQRLDINQNGNFNIKEEFRRMIDSKTQANPEWEKNELRRSKVLMTEGSSAALKSTIVEIAMENPDLTNDELLAAAKARLHKSNLTTSIIMNKQITGVSDGLIELVKNNGSLSDRDLNLLNLLQDGSDDSISEFLYTIGQDKNGDIDLSTIANEKLRGIVEMTYKNFEKAEDISHISIKEGKYNPLFSMPIDEQWKRDQAGQLRVEMLKDIMIRQSEGSNPEPDSVMRWIYGLGASNDQTSTLENIGMLGIFENYMKIDGKVYDGNIGTRFNVGGSEDKLSVLLEKDGILNNTFSNRMDELIEGFSPRTKNYLGGVNQTNFYDEYNELTLVKESGLHPLNIIKNINSFIKDGDGTSLINTLKEFNGGRNNPANVSELTLQLQNSVTRINYSLAEIGLNLSSDSMGSPLQSYLNFGLKRVLPIMAGAKAFEYVNDTSRTLFGSSVTEAAARGASYMDIGARKALYNVGVGDQINSWAESSVIHEYLFGSNKFETSEERADWYDNGYSPVRKGRFWGFGSSSEFRGSNIAYWQPNYLRRAQSNYHDVSVYGSSEEKWAHSFIPTPTHPFSTIRAIANPYWLEKKHLKENDRPYPLTAKMFSEGTPWGAVLNPTVGEILKPVRMLPKARMRLGKHGRDINSVLENINNRIKSKDRDNSLILVNGSDVRNGEYVPFGNPENGEINLSIRNGRAVVPGYGYMNGLENIKEYETPNGQDYIAGYGNGTNRSIEVNNYDDGLLNKIERTEKGVITELSKGFSNGQTGNNIATGLISGINNYIKNRNLKHGAGYRNINSVNSGPIKSDGTYIYKNLVNDYNNYLDNFYAKDDIKMINSSRQADYMRDIVYSNKQISGMYGYLASLALDGGNTHTFRYENAGQMASFSRGFWDSSIGGLGGGTMEIARRFFPSEDRRRININPLRNNMPDWIPDTYHTGDPYTNIPKGEMRLPGKGYETINALHPDQFGDYGAFDRFKILADIAPNSSEYKRWKNIAKATTADPQLAEEVKKITERTVKMSGNHEFFNYKFLHSKTKYNEGIIKSIGEDGTINLSDDTILTLSGLTLLPGSNYDLSEMITPGSKITYRSNRNRQYDRENSINNISAIVYKQGSSQSINKQLLDSNKAEVDVEDNTTLASLAKLSPVQEFSGAIQEAFAHAPIPMLHNKFLKVESAYESYMNETYYGSNFKTWDHPTKSFIKPMFNKQSGKSLASEALSLGIAYNHFHNILKGSVGNRGFVVNSIEKAFGKPFKQSTVKHLSSLALITSNPTAFFGGNAMYILHMSNGGSGRGRDLTNWQRGAKWGTIAGTVKYAFDNADNPVKSAGGMAMAGFMLGGQTNFGWELLEKSLGKMNARKGAVIGAGIGLAMSAIKNPKMDKSKMFNGWTPKETRKKWELDEYFDRLTYIKYSGLYKEASRRARRFEHTDVQGLFKDIDKNKEKVSKLNIRATKLAKKQKNGHDKYAREIQQIEEKKMSLEEQVTMFYKGGKYTDAAIAYKKKMESTMFGIDNAASKDEILAAVPQQYKDFYSSFVDETDPKERKKILKSMTPIMRRPLQAAWGMKLEGVKSNRRYFGVHAMPNSGWRGWKPNTNLKHVKMKTIQNEGMLLSDFGYYDSEKAKSNYESAPDIDHYDKGSGITRMHEMRQALRGSGLHLQNVSVDQTSAPGTWIFSDIKERTSEYARVGGYGVSKALSTLF